MLLTGNEEVMLEALALHVAAGFDSVLLEQGRPVRMSRACTHVAPLGMLIKCQ